MKYTKSLIGPPTNPGNQETNSLKEGFVSQ